MNENSKLKKFFAKLKKVKHIEIIIAVIAVLVMLLLYFSTKVIPNSDNKVEAESETQNYCQRIERQLADVLSSMKGVGKTKIVINWESSVESVLANSTSNSNNSSSSEPKLIQTQSSTKPIVLKELYPKAIGVIIICQGGDDVKIKINIITAVSVLLNITPDKVIVHAMST